MKVTHNNMMYKYILVDNSAALCWGSITITKMECKFIPNSKLGAYVGNKEEISEF